MTGYYRENKNQFVEGLPLPTFKFHLNSKPQENAKPSKKRKYGASHYPNIQTVNGQEASYIPPPMADFQSKKKMQAGEDEDMQIERLANFNFDQAHQKQ